MRCSLFGVGAIAGLTLLSTAVQAAPAALSAEEQHDMACFMGLGIAASRADKQEKPDPVSLDNMKLATFYFAGKVAARHPGNNIMGVVQQHKEEVGAALSKLDGKTCMQEAAGAMKPPAGAATPSAPTPTPPPAKKP
jgi:hypothetical protein